MTEACGGCGEIDPSKRCIGCLHDFNANPKPNDPYAWIKGITMARGGRSHWYVKCRSGSYDIMVVRYDSLRDDGSFLVWLFDHEGGFDLEEIPADDFFMVVDEPKYLPK